MLRHQKIIYWLWLKLALGDSSTKTYKIYNEFGDIEVIYKAGPESYKDLKFLNDDNLRALCDKNTAKAHETYCLCDANNIDIVTIEDDDYPGMLKHLDTPPL